MNLPSLKPRWDAVVVGSGHNGLVAAAYLGMAGKSVLVLEKSSGLGGATTSQRIFPDYDAWLSRYAYLVSLLPQQIIEELQLEFQTRRRATASFTPWTDPTGQPRGLLLSNEDPRRSQQSLRELTGDESGWDGLNQLWQMEATLAETVWPSLLQPLRSRSQFKSHLQSQAQRAAWEALVERPIGELIERLFTHDLLRGLVMTDAKIGVLSHPHDPSLLQNRCFLYHVIGGGTGEWRVPVGGMRSLVESLTRRCQSQGVTCLTDAPATRIVVGQPLHEVVFDTPEGEQTVQAQHVLVNAGPRCFSRLLGTSYQTAADDEGSAIKMNLLLSRLPRVKAAGVSPSEAFSGSLHIDEGYQWMQQSYQLARQGTVPNPPPCEIYCHTLTDNSILSPALAAAGYQTLTLFGLDMPYRLFEQEHDRRRDQVRELYLAGIDRLCEDSIHECLARDQQGQPCIEIMTPQDLEREADLDWGNIFHNQLTWFFADDPSQVGQWGVETQFPRVYRAGSSAVRGGAVSGIPGRNAAMCILQNR